MRIVKLSIEETANCLQSYDKSRWTHNEVLALANYLQEYERRLGREINIDLFTIWRDWSCYRNLKELRISFPDCPSGYHSAVDWLRSRQHVIPVSNEENDTILIAGLYTLEEL